MIIIDDSNAHAFADWITSKICDSISCDILHTLHFAERRVACNTPIRGETAEVHL